LDHSKTTPFDMNIIQQEMLSSIVSNIGLFEDLQIPFLILHVRSSFSPRRLTSQVRGRFLEFQASFALGAVQSLHDSDSVEEYVEFEKRSKIFNIVGDWRTHIHRLTAHEIAHIIDLTAPLDNIFGSRIQENYGVVLESGKTRKHHNNLWRMIYADLTGRTPSRRL